MHIFSSNQVKCIQRHQSMLLINSLFASVRNGILDLVIGIVNH